MRVIEPHETPYGISLFQEDRNIVGCMGSRILAEGREMYLDVGWLFFRNDVTTAIVSETLAYLQLSLAKKVSFVTIHVDFKDAALVAALKQFGFEEMSEGKFIKYAQGRASV